MGTSTPFPGGRNGNPLVPSWLAPVPGQQPDGSQDPKDPGGGDGDPDKDQKADPSKDSEKDPKPEPATAQFRSARTLFNRHVRSAASGDGGGTPGLRRAIGSYVSRGGGGASTVAGRLSAGSGGAVQRFGEILLDASRDGIREVVRRLDLASLATRSLREIYASLIDVVCGEGGDLDEAMNRNAYNEAVDELAEELGDGLERPSADTVNLLIERFMVGTVGNLISLAVGNRVVTLPASPEDSTAVQEEVRDWVGGAVRAAMARTGGIFERGRIRSTIDRIYARALAILEAGEDSE